MGGTPAEQVIRGLPFRGEAIEDIECEKKDGQVTCRVGIVGAPSRQIVVLGDHPGFEKAACTRTSNGDMACEVQLSGSNERTKQVIPRDLLP